MMIPLHKWLHNNSPSDRAIAALWQRKVIVSNGRTIAAQWPHYHSSRTMTAQYICIPWPHSRRTMTALWHRDMLPMTALWPHYGSFVGRYDGTTLQTCPHENLPATAFYLIFIYIFVGRQKESEQKLTRMETLTPEENDIYENVDVDVAKEKTSWLSSLVSTVLRVLVLVLVLCLCCACFLFLCSFLFFVCLCLCLFFFFVFLFLFFFCSALMFLFLFLLF